MEALLDLEGLPTESNPVALVLPTLACLFSTLTGGRKVYDGCVNWFLFFNFFGNKLINVNFQNQSYQILRVNLNTTRAYNTMNGIYLTNTLDFLTPPTMNNPTDVVVCPEQLPSLKTLLTALDIPYEVNVKDLERFDFFTYKITDLLDFFWNYLVGLSFRNIIQERTENELRRSDGMNWDAYQRLSTVINFYEIEKIMLKPTSIYSILFADSKLDGHKSAGAFFCTNRKLRA